MLKAPVYFLKILFFIFLTYMRLILSNNEPFFCSRGEIGRRVRLRSVWVIPWRFESSREQYCCRAIAVRWWWFVESLKLRVFEKKNSSSLCHCKITLPFLMNQQAHNHEPRTTNYELSSQRDEIKNLFSEIATRYELANHLLCGGLDLWWRHVTAREVAKQKPHLILDVATGSGDLAVALLKKISTAQITGVDFCEEMLAEAAKKKIPALTLVTADGLALPFPEESYDAVTIAFGLRNMESWEKGLHEMNRVLRRGAPIFILDFSLPTLPLLKPLYRFYLHHILPRFAGLITGRSEAYSYMADSIEKFPSGTKMCSLLEQCGFERATFKPMTFGVVTLYVAVKKTVDCRL